VNIEKLEVKWSDKQIDIFSWFSSISLTEVKHLVVRARAGTGKTTTITEAVKRAPSNLNFLVCAFGKNIQLELAKRFLGVNNVQVKTLHAVGLSCVMRFWPGVAVKYASDRENDLAQRVCGSTAPDAIKKLVAKLCTKGRLTTPYASTLGDLTDVAVTFECEPDAEWRACQSCGFEREEHNGDHAYTGFDLQYVETKALEAMELAASEKPARTGIDGADMLFLPVRNHWMRKTYDVVVVDEAQDMNTSQLELAQGMSKGPIVVVGDDCQAIYGFAGADSGSLDRLKVALTADELPLNVTYRCGKAIVAVAQRYVPDFMAGDDNPEGAVEMLPMENMAGAASAGDFILSRVNAPLVSIAMSLLRSGKRARIAGRDIGAGLVNLVRKMKAKSVPDLLRRIASWEEKEASRLASRYAGKLDSSTYTARREGLHDQAEMLASLTDGAPSVSEVVSRIEALFTDDGLGAASVVTCSSVHRAKGLEAKRVFVLGDTLRHNNQEERNIAYVAVTRAKETLVWVK
jgi:hypothetical protein